MITTVAFTCLIFIEFLNVFTDVHLFPNIVKQNPLFADHFDNNFNNNIREHDLPDEEYFEWDIAFQY